MKLEESSLVIECNVILNIFEPSSGFQKVVSDHLQRNDSKVLDSRNNFHRYLCSLLEDEETYTS